MKIETFFVPMQYMMLFVTARCNLECTYCKVNASYSPAPQMTLDTAKRSVKLLIENSNYSSVSVNLHGGEPLLLSNQWIEEFVGYSKGLAAKNSKKISFPITTNGTLLTGKRISWLLQEGINFCLSCDGPPEINNISRQDGDRVQKAIVSFKNCNYPITAMTVITRNNYERITEIMDWFSVMGIRNMVTNFISPQGRGSFEDLLTPEEMLESSKQALEHMYTTGVAVLMRPLINSISWFVEGHQATKTMSCYKSECAAGKNIVSINTSGEISLCAAIDQGEYIVGNINNEDFDQSNYETALSRFHGLGKNYLYCKECSISHTCYHGCTAICKKSDQYKERHCEYTHLFWDYLNKNSQKAERIYDILKTRN